MSRQTHNQLLQLLDTALAAVNGARCVRAALMAHPPQTPVRLVAIGKAASAMTLGALDVLGDSVDAGLIVTKPGHLAHALIRHPLVECTEAGHPVPDAASLAAGDRLLRFLDTTPDGVGLLFLISGGASSLVEVPRMGVTLADLQRVNRWLLASGLDIHSMNGVRKRLSRIKGGGLLSRLGERHTEAFLISDVPGDDPADIGAGLLVPSADSPLPEVPEWLDALLAAAAADAPVISGAASPRIQIVASLAQAMEAAAATAIDVGYHATLHDSVLSGDAGEVGRDLARWLLSAPPGVHIWGGETVVRLPPEPGQGGRNQTLALAAATVLAGREDLCLLAVGTDGSDGPGSDAGGLVDGGTIARGSDAGLDAEMCLARADAGTFLAASGDLVDTGPTGTNVMDLIIGLKSA